MDPQEMLENKAHRDLQVSLVDPEMQDQEEDQVKQASVVQ